MKTRFHVLLAAMFAALALIAGPRLTQAQGPEKFTNLRVFPKNIAREELLATMRGFSGALGVRCNFCHAEGDTTKSRGLDFASDARAEKRTARVMMKMVKDINGKLIPKAGIQSPASVGCVTCHHGLSRPETLADALERAVEKDGVPAAQARYRELRGKYYGSGAYDFRPGSLNSVAEWLADARKDPDGAIAVANMSLEFDPNDAGTYAALGRAQALKGDKAAAVASYQHALTLDPENRRVKELLEAVQSGK